METRLARLRRRCREDLIFLARHVLQYDRITEETHGNVARLFIQKREGVKTIEQSEIKERLLMMPRGVFKSTLDVCDIVQTILVDPDVRILVLTAASDLASAFLGEIASHFVIKSGNRLPLIFPEYCIKEGDVKGETFLCPARTKTYKEPTVMAAGIEANLSGYHFDELRCDDVVSNRNSQTPGYLERTRANIHMARKMLNPGGNMVLIGTHYSPSDAYAMAINHACDEAGLNREEVERTLIEEPEPVLIGDLLVLRKPAWIHKSGKSHLTPDELKRAEDFELVFPSILSHKFLAKEYRKDPQSFFTQYLNDPYVAAGAIFTPEILRQATVPADQIPEDGQIFAVWDLAYKNGRMNDHTACIVGKLHNGIMYVLDTVYAKYRPSEIGAAIAATAIRWSARQVDIEDCLGAQWLESSIRNSLYNHECTITWIPIDRSESSKHNRIKSIEKVIAEGRLYFSAQASNLTVVYDQLLQAGTTDRDDLADALAYLTARVPIDRLSTPEVKRDPIAEARQRALYRLVYGIGEPPPMPEEPDLYSLPKAGEDEICPGLGF